MGYTFDHIDGVVYEWTAAGDDGAATVTTHYDYHSRFYIAGPATTREEYADAMAQHPEVVNTETVTRRTGFRSDPEDVLAVDVATIDAITRLARQATQFGLAGELRCYNVDFSREFRFCLETGIDPTPATTPSTTTLGIPDDESLQSGPPDTLLVDGRRIGGDYSAGSSTARVLLDELQDHIDDADPDILIVDTADIVPELYDLADAIDYPLQLGRGQHADTYQQLAGESTYTSYGRRGYSPARYNVPGRALIDRSNTFFLRKTNLAGCLDLVERSYKPIQELSWASIGNVLTAIQIREATSRNVLAQWRAWRHERPKSMGTLRNADRGGFTFSPDVGVHEDVYELDFSSLYPNIIIQHNISPETVRCDCCYGDDVPELGYSICTEEGYLPDVLRPLVSERDDIKRRLAETDNPEERAALEGQSSAIKWVLVSCFGYQGFSNAKFGRIECHETINAYAREILLDAKTALEDAGWRVVHGIVDSLWVQRDSERDQRPLEEVAAEITDDVGIRLEQEGTFDWVAFVPQRNSDTGALTKYFGRYTGVPPEYKYRGIECRQRSTPPYIASVQEDLIETYDQYCAPEPVIDRLSAAIEELRANRVNPEALMIKTCVSASPEEYRHTTRTVSALHRAKDTQNLPHVGGDVEYVVTNDSARGRNRVCLASENPESYDPTYYVDELIRAAETVLSPVGVRRADIKDALSESISATLARWSSH